MLRKLALSSSRRIRATTTNRAALLISVSFCLISLALYAKVYLLPSSHPSPFLQFLLNVELKTLDVRFQLRGKRPPASAVVIVAVDQKSQDIMGRWPFPRSNFAQAVDFLREAHARVIAFDMNFPQPDANSALEVLHSVQADYNQFTSPPLHSPPFEAKLKGRLAGADNDQQFADALSRFDNVILGYFFIAPDEAKSQDQKRLKEFVDLLSFQAYPRIIHPEYARNYRGPTALALSPNLPQFSTNAKNFGFFYIDPDPDGTVRREPAVVEFQGGFYPSLDIAAALAYVNESLERVKLVFNPNGVEKVVLGERAIPTDSRGFVQLDYVGPAGTFPTYSLSDVVRRQLSPELFRDRLVLIGTTATGIGDMALTPFTAPPFPGVEVHANMIDDILNQHFIRRGAPEYATDVAVIILFTLGAGLLLSVLGPLRGTLLLGGSLILYSWFTYYLFAHHRIWIAAFLPLSTLFVTYAGIVSYRFFFEEAEKKKIRSVFSQYMHPALIAQILKNPETLRLGGEEKELTVLFADIRGFTTLSELLTPVQLVDLLNEYLSAMTDLIFKNWGTLDKYIGDAIMAFWGAPYPQNDHAVRACRAALEMLRVLKQLEPDWTSKGMPCLEIGVGINTGPMLVGNMGSSRRFNYTIMGDSVNLASRLEGLNRQFGTDLIVSEATFLQVRGQVLARELDLIRVKGKGQPVKIYEVLGLAEDSDPRRGLVERFQEGLAMYRDGEWKASLEFFRGIIRDYPLDGPSHVFARRCQDLLARPPKNAWDGVFTMETK